MIGDVLKQARKDAGLTQQELAFETDLSRSYISFVERNEKNSSLKTLFKIYVVLEVRPSKFVERVEKETAREFNSP